MLSNQHNFHSLEVVDRVSDPQLQVIEMIIVCLGMAILLCKDKRQYLLTCDVIRYLFLTLHGSIVSI